MYRQGIRRRKIGRRRREARVVKRKNVGRMVMRSREVGRKGRAKKRRVRETHDSCVGKM